MHDYLLAALAADRIRDLHRHAESTMRPAGSATRRRRARAARARRLLAECPEAGPAGCGGDWQARCA
jgi:hypothetical protein